MEKRRSITVKEIILEVNSMVSNEKTPRIYITSYNGEIIINSSYNVFTALTEGKHNKLRMEVFKLFESGFGGY